MAKTRKYKKYRKKSRTTFIKNRRSRSKYKKNKIFNKKNTRKIRRRRNIRGGILNLITDLFSSEEDDKKAALREAESQAARLELEMERVNREVRQEIEEKQRVDIEKMRQLNIQRIEKQREEKERKKKIAREKELEQQQRQLNDPSIDIYTRIDIYNQLKPLPKNIHVNFCDFIHIQYIEHISQFNGTGITEGSGYTTNDINLYFFEGMGHCYGFIFILKNTTSYYYMYHWFFQESRPVIEILKENKIDINNIKKILTFSQYAMPTNLCIQLIQLSNNNVENYLVETRILTIDIKVFNVPITSNFDVKCRETDAYMGRF